MFLKKKSNPIHFIPGLILLIMGMVALHSVVTLSSKNEIMQSHYEFLAQQYQSQVGQDNVPIVQKFKVLNGQIDKRETWLYWSVITISFTAFLLLILNADKFRKLEQADIEKREAFILLEQRLAALEASVEGTAIIDPDGNLIYMNRALMDLHGVSQEEYEQYKGQSWLELYSLDDQEYFLEEALAEFEKTNFWRGKGKITNNAGGQVSIELSLTSLNDGGVIATVRDDSQQQEADAEKKNMQDQLYQAQKMEAVGRLAGGIAHDFNNILAAMNGYAEFLEMDLPDGSPMQQYAKNILQAGKQARAMVDKILTFSRRDTNALITIDLCGPLKETLSLLQATMPKTIELHADLKLESAYIEGNETQLSQLIMNLCVNARDAMKDEKGRIEITLSEVDIHEDIPMTFLVDELPASDTPPLIRLEDGLYPKETHLYMGSISRNHKYIRLSVADNGSGISRPVMEHIFEPFFTTKDTDKGTGLGLATTHGSLTAHRGALYIDTMLGKGTRFDLFFPLNEDIKVEQAQDVGYDMSEHTGSLLLVDDQPEVMAMTKTMLERLGHEVTTTSNGLEALDVLREFPDQYDLVITDQNMPKMTGLELINQACIDFPDMAFILLSGYSEEKLEDLMREHQSIKEIVRKPISQNALGAKIAKVLSEASSAKANAA